MRYLIGLLLILTTSIGSAAQVKGINIPDQIKVSPDKIQLNLLGAGVRSKFIVDVYVGAFFANSSLSSPQAAVKHSGPKTMHMYFTYNVSGPKMQTAWSDGIKANNSSKAIQSQGKNINKFLRMFGGGLKSGDKVEIDFLSNKSTRVKINGSVKGKISGKAFNDLILNTWMGPKPPSKAFQRSLLK